ncbi:MAG: ABC transporter substrate-binding protein [Minwuia sp.]|uniref:ABC transporter substrate-binding protein n=1 Tax=Minwuia sp. TaxID=2493630 RepID=UPI003A8732B6
MKHFGTIAAAAALSAAAIFGAQAEEPKQGGTLTLLTSQVPRHFNPAVQSGTATGRPGTQIFATLLRYDEGWEPQPYLAESWSWSEDGLVMTVKLRAGAKFHDGEPITSEDVKFSIQTVKENHPFKTMFGAVETVETPDELTAVIKLTQPHPALELAMSSALLPIIPEHVYSKLGEGETAKNHPMNATPVGSGPFKFKEYKQGEYIILEKNEDYFLPGKPYLDRIVYKIVRDSSQRVITMEQGEADFYTEVESINIRRLEEAENLVVTDTGGEAIGPITWLAFNTKKAPFDNVKVRQAIAYAVDRNFIIKALQRGVSKPATGPIAPSSPFYSENVETYDVDLDKANALLDEAGLAAGDGGIRFAATIDYLPALPEQQKNIAEYLKPQLKKIGIDLTVRNAPDFPTWAKRVSSWDFDMTMDLVFNWGDPVIGVHRTYICDNIVQGVIWSNTQQFCDERVDSLLSRAAREIDLDARKKLYADFQRVVAEELPIYWLNVVPYTNVYSKKLVNPPLGIWSDMHPLDNVGFRE